MFEFVKNEMGRDFVHACGGTFAYIIWPGDIASSEHMDNLFMMCPWNLFLHAVHIHVYVLQVESMEQKPKFICNDRVNLLVVYSFYINLSF